MLESALECLVEGQSVAIIGRTEDHCQILCRRMMDLAAKNVVLLQRHRSLKWSTDKATMEFHPINYSHYDRKTMTIRGSAVKVYQDHAAYEGFD